jgi:virginiamycin B lyase
MHRIATTMVAATVVLTLEAILVGSLGASRFAARQAAVGQGASGAAALQVKLVIKEWDVPTPDSHPHDPAVAPDGALWYTGQMSNTLGRLDPKTGRIQEFRLTTPDSGPHGLVADQNGDIWFTANFKGYIGKLDPRTGKITEYPIADKGADDPHTPVFDQKGMLWFTVQQGNAVGRLDPRNGMIILKKVPTGHALPYGIAVNSKGVPFFCEFGTNKLASINPETMEITEYPLPRRGARPRRLAIASDDKVYYSDYARGYLGELDSTTGKTQEWPSPGGPGSEPYGITTTSDGMVWYAETGVTPNRVVGFNPKTQSFSAPTPIASGGGVVRNMVASPDGKLYLACSGVNKIAIAEVVQ